MSFRHNASPLFNFIFFSDFLLLILTATIGLILLDLSQNLMKAITKDISQSKVKVGVIQKNIFSNLLLDFGSVIQQHGLYPQGNSLMRIFAPQLYTAFEYLIKKKRDKRTKERFTHFHKALLSGLHPGAFSTAVKGRLLQILEKRSF